MTTYAEELAAISSKPRVIVRITCDFCGLAYGVSPCTASGSAGQECYNTLSTCQAPDDYQASPTGKVYKFCLNEGGLPLRGETIRPLLAGWPKSSASEIKPEVAVTSNAKITLKFFDERDTDIGIDPYVANRTYTPEETGTFWGKWLARNKYYLGREVLIKEGFEGLAEDNYKKRKYVIDQIKGPNNGVVEIVCKDPLKKADRVKIPAPTDGKYDMSNMATVSDNPLSAGATTVNCNDTSDYPSSGRIYIESEAIDYTGKTSMSFTGCTRGAGDTTAAEHAQGSVIDSGETTVVHCDDTSAYAYSGFIRIDNEIIEYTGKTATSFTSCTRGRDVGNIATAPAQHSQSAKIQQCAVWEATNGWDIIYDILTNTDYIGLAANDVDSDGAGVERDAWLSAFSFTACISKPTEASKLLKELVEQTISSLWWSEEVQTVKFKVFSPPLPHENVAVWDETKNLMSVKTDNNEASRFSRVIVFYNKKTLEDDDKIGSYENAVGDVDADAEGTDQYGEPKTKVIYSRWITTSVPAATISTRLVRRFRDPAKKADLEVWQKDSSPRCGDIVDLTLKSHPDSTGAPIEGHSWQITKKERASAGKFSYAVMDTAWYKKYIFISPTGYPDYGSATDAQRKYWFIGRSSDNHVGGGLDEGYYIY